MDHHNFYEFQDGHRNRKSKNTTLPLLESLSLTEFRKGSREMWFKQNFDEDYQDVQFLKSKFRLDPTPMKKSQPRGILSIKRLNILKLVDLFHAAIKKILARNSSQ